MFTRFIFWPWFSGLVFLIAGLLLVRKKLAPAPGIEKLVVLGPVFYAVPLAVFGAEHLAGAQFLQEMVPGWIPWHLFWAYFVGLALVSSAVSILLNRYVGWTGILLGIMMFSFVALLHIPRVMANPKDRISWVVALRDCAFAGAAWALAGTRSRRWKSSRALITAGRFCVGVPLLFCAIQYFLYPNSAPGVPLEKLTPSWVPLGGLWGYPMGAVLLAAGMALLLQRRSRLVAAWAGLVVAIVAVVIYLPGLILASKPSEMNEATNYIADTLFFSGAILILAGTVPAEEKEPAMRAAAAD